MHRTQYILLSIALIAIIAVAAFLVALTRPGFTTPIVERVATSVSDHETTIASARVAYTPLPVLRMEQVTIEDRLQAETLDITPSLLGWLPGIPLARYVEAANGRVMIDRTEPSSRSTDYDLYVDRVSLQDLDIVIERPEAVTRFTILEGSGSLHGGDLSFDAIAGDGRLYFDGGGGLNDISTVRGGLVVEGDNLASVADALGIAAPDMPPFRLEGDLSVEGEAWTFSDIGGEIGDSDVTGVLLVEFGGDKPFIEADLSSQSLDFDDLGVIFGLPSTNEDGEALNEAQETANTAYSQSDRFIPRARIDRERLRLVNAAVTYEAAEVIDAPFAISSFSMALEIDDALVTVTSIEASAASGTLSLSGEINAREDPAQSRLNASLSGIAIESLVPGDIAQGTLEGRVDLALSGENFRTAFANSNGSAAFWSEQARVAAVTLEAADLDLGEALVTLVSENNDDRVYVDARCFVARLDVRDGIGTAAPVLLDTEDSTIIADGTVGLREETLDLTVHADAKDLSWGSLMGDISVNGRWRDPGLSANPSGTPLQTLFAAVLGSVAGPLAALPFIEPGDGEDAPCTSLLTRARTAQAN